MLGIYMIHYLFLKQSWSYTRIFASLSLLLFLLPFLSQFQKSKQTSPYTLTASSELQLLLTDLPRRCPLHLYCPASEAEADSMVWVVWVCKVESFWISWPSLFHVYVQPESPCIWHVSSTRSVGNTSNHEVWTAKVGMGISEEKQTFQTLFKPSLTCCLYLMFAIQYKSWDKHEQNHNYCIFLYHRYILSIY